MSEAASSSSAPSVFSPLAKALLDGFSEGVVVFDTQGRVAYANRQAREQVDGLGVGGAGADGDLLGRLASLGGRLHTLRVADHVLGEAMFIPGSDGPSTLAERERDAIVASLDAHGWKLAETAKQLGISRTTLWRRLKTYGLHRDSRSRWEISSS